jgi:phospholipid/cholesterol/gamma-HCH transport system substrate-binding protein
MSTRANPIVIGAFVVGAVALLVVALLVWGGTGLFRTKVAYVLFFDSAVTGLSKGAPVEFRGVKVGEVTAIQVRWGTTLVAVYVNLEPEALQGIAEGGPARRVDEAIQEGLRGQLRMQSFVTGVLFVALQFRPDTPIVFRGRDQRVREIPTIPTDLEVWAAKLERFAARIEKVPLEQIGQSVATLLEDIKQIVESKEAHDLVPNANAAISDIRTLVHRVDAQIDPTFAQLNGALTRLAAALDAGRQLANHVDGRVDPLATQAEATLEAAQGTMSDLRPLIEDLRRIAAKVDAQADPLLASIHSTSDTARTTLERAQVTLGSLDRTLDQGSPLGYELFRTLKEFRATAQALRSLADYLERVPDSLVRGVRRPAKGAP